MNDRAKFLSTDELKRQKIQAIRECFSELYDAIDGICESGRETALAMARLEEAQFWAIKGITREKE